MKTRILTAAIALPILIAAIILPLWWREAVWVFVAIAGFALAAGLFEFYSLTKKLELKADAAIGYLQSDAPRNATSSTVSNKTNRGRVIGLLFSLAPGPYPRRVLTLMPRLGFARPRLGMAAGAPCPPRLPCPALP